MNKQPYLQDPRDADDAVRKLDGFQQWVSFLALCTQEIDRSQDTYEHWPIKHTTDICNLDLETMRSSIAKVIVPLPIQ